MPEYCHSSLNKLGSKASGFSRMIPYSIVLILVLGANLVDFTHGQYNTDFFNGGGGPNIDWKYLIDMKSNLQAGYLSYYDCTLKCFGGVFQLSYIYGNFCNGSFQLYSNDWSPVPFQQVVQVVQCITLNCQTTVHKSVCDASYDYPNDQYVPGSPSSATNYPIYAAGSQPNAPNQGNSPITGTNSQAVAQSATETQAWNLGYNSNQPALNYNPNSQSQITPLPADFLKNSQTPTTQDIQGQGTTRKSIKNKFWEALGIKQTPNNPGASDSNSFAFANSGSQTNQAPNNLGSQGSNSFTSTNAGSQVNQAPYNFGGAPGSSSLSYANSASQVNQDLNNLGSDSGCIDYNKTPINSKPLGTSSAAPMLWNRLLNNQGSQGSQLPTVSNDLQKRSADQKPSNDDDDAVKKDDDGRTYDLQADGSINVYQDGVFVRKIRPFR